MIFVALLNLWFVKESVERKHNDWFGICFWHLEWIKIFVTDPRKEDDQCQGKSEKDFQYLELV